MISMHHRFYYTDEHISGGCPVRHLSNASPAWERDGDRCI
jgi:hypothetical protein